MIVNAFLHLPLVYGVITIRLKSNRKVRNSKEEVVIKRMPNGISRIYNKILLNISALIERRKSNADHISLSVKEEFSDVSLLCGMNAFMLVAKLNENNKFIAAICASPAMVLSAAGIEENRYITAYPGEDFEEMLGKANYVEELVVVDENIITSRGPATTLLFAYKIVDILGGNSESLKEGMLWNKLEEEVE